MLTASAGYSPANARFLADCARAAYLSGEALKHELDQVLGLPAPIEISCQQTDTQAFVVNAPGFSVVAFRGTESIKDWITDADFRWTPTEEGRVHQGFYEAWKSVRLKILNALPVDPLNPIWITGHSLGGALAILCAEFLGRRLSKATAGVYTFGQPRVGDGEYSAHYNRLLGSKTFRLVNREDPVPRMPPALLRYRHSSSEIFFDELGRRLENPPLWWKIISDVLGVWRAGRERHLIALPNHFMERYIELTNEE